MARKPRHKPTEKSRQQVEQLSATGTRHSDIALLLSISEDTLTRHYRTELDRGRIVANQAIAGSLYQSAKSGNVTAMIFWLKTRAGWKETQVHEVTGANGNPMNVKFIDGPPQESRDEWEARVRREQEARMSGSE